MRYFVKLILYEPPFCVSGTHKRDPFLNLLPLFWGKKDKRNTWNTASDLSMFSQKAST